MLLKNEKRPEALKLEFSAGENAVKNMITCLFSVYGNEANYVNPKMFDEGFVIDQVRRGNLNVFSGTTKDGAVTSTISAKRIPRFSKSFELSSLAVDEEYRGFRLGMVIVEHALNECKKKDASLFYAHVVMFNALAGEAFENSGFVPTGFLLGFCDAKKHLSELNCISQKHTLAILVKNNGKIATDTVYMPECLTYFARKTYASLGVSPNIENRPHSLDGVSLIEYEQDNYHKTLYLYISKCGDDLLQKVKKIEQCYKDALQTNIVFLNINDSSAIHGFEILKESGYIFAGLKPLCGDHEFIVMAKTGDVVLDYTELRITPLTKALLNEVGELG